MDNNLISKLSIIVNDNINQSVSRADSKKSINALFHNKSNKTIINELTNYIEKKEGKTKNLATIIVILSLFLRNLDCDTELISLVKNNSSCNEFVNCLYGGLITLLSGKSKALLFEIEWNYSDFANKLEFIARTADFDYWHYFAFIKTFKIMAVLDNEKFEDLVLKDKTNFIILSIVNYHLNVKISDKLMRELINNNDEVKQNIAFYLLTVNISKNMEKLRYITDGTDNKISMNKDFNTTKKLLRSDTEKCLDFLKLCSNKTQCSLLINYILQHQEDYPCVFANQLLSNELQDEFIMQIRFSSKIRVLKDIYSLAYLVYNNSALNEHKKHISKNKLYNAIIDLLIDFIKHRKIYALDKQNTIYITHICSFLPIKCLQKLERFLINERKNLMCENIDRLLRFDIFLKDSRQSEIIDGILEILHKNN